MDTIQEMKTRILIFVFRPALQNHFQSIGFYPHKQLEADPVSSLLGTTLQLRAFKIMLRACPCSRRKGKYKQAGGSTQIGRAHV